MLWIYVVIVMQEVCVDLYVASGGNWAISKHIKLVMHVDNVKRRKLNLITNFSISKEINFTTVPLNREMSLQTYMSFKVGQNAQGSSILQFHV